MGNTNFFTAENAEYAKGKPDFFTTDCTDGNRYGT
jgi:hypothetical protein